MLHHNSFMTVLKISSFQDLPDPLDLLEHPETTDLPDLPDPRELPDPTDLPESMDRPDLPDLLDPPDLLERRVSAPSTAPSTEESSSRTELAAKRCPIHRPRGRCTSASLHFLGLGLSSTSRYTTRRRTGQPNDSKSPILSSSLIAIASSVSPQHYLCLMHRFCSFIILFIRHPATVHISCVINYLLLIFFCFSFFFLDLPSNTKIVISGQCVLRTWRFFASDKTG